MNLEEKTNILKLCKEEPLSTCNVTIRQNQVKKLLKHGIIRPSISPLFENCMDSVEKDGCVRTKEMAYGNRFPETKRIKHRG